MQTVPLVALIFSDIVRLLMIWSSLLLHDSQVAEVKEEEFERDELVIRETLNPSHSFPIGHLNALMTSSDFGMPANVRIVKKIVNMA